jgi:hypothetical protein
MDYLLQPAGQFSDPAKLNFIERQRNRGDDAASGWLDAINLNVQRKRRCGFATPTISIDTLQITMVCFAT